MIPLSGVAELLHLSQPDTEVITRRGDFPSPVLVTPKYVYWDSTSVERWLLHLHITYAELQSLVTLAVPDTGDDRREHFYVRQCDLQGTDDGDLLSDGFTLLSDEIEEYEYES